MIYALRHLALLGLLGAAFWLPGYALERWALRARELGALRGLARWVLGLAAWIAALFALAAAQSLRPAPVALVAGAGALAALAAWRRAGGSPSPDARGGPPGGLWLAGASVLLAPLFLVAIAPGVSWDASTYHLTLPRLYLEHGGFRAVPLNVYSNWPLGAELLYAAALLAGDYTLAKALHFGFGALVLYALWAACRDAGRGDAAGLAGVLFLANGVVLAELLAAYVDLAHAFFFLCGFLFMLRAQAPGCDARPALALAGLCCGVAAGLKVNGITSGVPIAALALPRLARAVRRGALRPAAAELGVWFALPALALWLPWLAKAAWATGNPVYPFLYGWLGGPDWSADLAARFGLWQRSIGMGRDALDYALLPLRVILRGGPHYARFDGEIGAFWIALLPLSIAVAVARRDARLRAALAAAAVAFGLWALSSQQMRFLIPVLPLLALSAATAAHELARGLPDRLRTRSLHVAALAAAAAFGLAYRGPFERGFELLGHYRAGVEELERAAVHPVYRFLDANLPLEARLLLLNTNQGFFCPRPYLADSFFQASQIADWLRGAGGAPQLAERLEARGVTHVLLEQRSWGIRYPPALQQLLRDPQRAALIHESEDSRFRVYELRRGRGSSLVPDLRAGLG